jgi:hypothetical protein
MEDEFVKEILSGIKEAISDIRTTQKEMQADIGEIKITQAEQHITLQEHTKRSTANEEHLKTFKEYIIGEVEKLKKIIGSLKVL